MVALGTLKSLRAPKEWTGQHVGTGCGREPEAVTAAGYLLLDPNSGPQTQGNFFTTCERRRTTAPVDASKPVPHDHPDGWVEGLYDPERGCTHHWCCDTCAEYLLGPDLRMGPGGEVLACIRGIDYVCSFCKAHVKGIVCEQCGGISAFAIFPLSNKERQALQDGFGEADAPTVDRLMRRGIVTREKRHLTPLGVTLRLLLLRPKQLVYVFL